LHRNVPAAAPASNRFASVDLGWISVAFVVAVRVIRPWEQRLIKLIADDVEIIDQLRWILVFRKYLRARKEIAESVSLAG
jgi:hypothetical protein